MNVVVSGPFGVGSLADEALLAGFLAYLKSAKHNITVLSPEPANVIEMHDVDALQLPSPGAILSAPKVWAALSKSHLFIVTSAGIINEKGEVPARTWLGQAEHARRAGARTAIMSLGAAEIADPRERVRVQRQLHNFTDYISVRDAESKRIVIGYGISATRVSHNGDFTLTLASQKVSTSAADRDRCVGIFLNATVPTRSEFGASTAPFSEDAIGIYRDLIQRLQEKKRRVRLFHDDTDLAREAAERICEDFDEDQIDLPDPGDDIETTRERLAACGVAFSPSLHGLILAATCGVMPIGLTPEPGAEPFLDSLGLKTNALGEFTADAVMKAAEDALPEAAGGLEKILAKVQGLLKKQAQDARTLELLVPRRDRRDTKGAGDDEDEDGEDIGEPRAHGGRDRDRGFRGRSTSRARQAGARGRSRGERPARKKADADPWFNE
ncbi:MAG TPA: polysaccharide pyruvyl transferase family protein [Planctomycetota bacterium]|nr:polysaccharide pyruvyl transferase family protein [Planctomycetota bacterium]